MIPMLAALPQWAVNLMVVLFLLISLIMVLVVLIQRPTGGGLSGAFGGASAGSSQTAFGARTGDVLTMVTIGIFVAFLLTAIFLNYQMDPTAIRSASTIGAPAPPPPTAPIPTGSGAAGQTPADGATDSENGDEGEVGSQLPNEDLPDEGEGTEPVNRFQCTVALQSGQD